MQTFPNICKQLFLYDNHARIRAWFFYSVATREILNYTSRKIMSFESQHLKPEDYYFCFDLGLSGALVTLGYELSDIDKTNSHKSQFIFKRKKGIDRDIERYWGGDLQISARYYFDSIKMIKNRLYSD